MIEVHKINLEKLEKIITLIITKKEDPTNKDLSFFGWDDRYELKGKKGAIFKSPEDETLRDIGLKAQYWGIEYVFFDFDQLLSLYPYSKCMLEILESYRHRDDVQHYIKIIKDLEDALSSTRQLLKNSENDAFNKVISCVKR